MSKPKKCQKCKSEKVLNIMYGEPEGPVPADIFLGGCEGLEEGDYQWHCGDCHWEWAWGRNLEGRYNQEAIDDEEEDKKS